MEIAQEAKREMKRMEDVFFSLKLKNKGKTKEFYEFAKNYFEDGKHFFDEKRFTQAFEAFIISWSYIDAGIKLGFFEVPERLKKHFTS